MALQKLCLVLLVITPICQANREMKTNKSSGGTTEEPNPLTTEEPNPLTTGGTTEEPNPLTTVPAGPTTQPSTIKSVKAIYMQMSANRYSARVGQKVKFTCSVYPARNVEATILFMRGKDGRGLARGSIQHTRAGCRVSPFASRYELSCVTSSVKSGVHTYTLAVDGVTVTDFADWWCVTREHGQQFNYIALKEIKLTIRLTSSSFTAYIGHSVNLTCSVSPADSLEDDIVIVSRVGHKAIDRGRFAQSVDHCDTHGREFRYRPRCGRGTTLTSAKTKSYVLAILDIENSDFTLWWCKTRNLRQRYNTITLSNAAYVHVMAGKSKSGDSGMLIMWVVLSVLFVIGTAISLVVVVRKLRMEGCLIEDSDSTEDSSFAQENPVFSG